jgi:hypothetical protein
VHVAQQLVLAVVAVEHLRGSRPTCARRAASAGASASGQLVERERQLAAAEALEQRDRTSSALVVSSSATPTPSA